MKKFIYDILRDKGSDKFSITKTIALAITIVLISYIFFTTYKGGSVDQFLIGQLILMILTLTGFKNSFGINKLQKKDEVTTVLDMKAEPIKNDEGEF